MIKSSYESKYIFCVLGLPDSGIIGTVYGNRGLFIKDFSEVFSMFLQTS